MIEKHLVEHCAPTLASLKTANLFSFKYDSKEELESTLDYWNFLLSNKGIKIRILKNENKNALIYVYRERLLEHDLNKAGVFDFLKKYGYEHVGIEYVLNKLSTRIKEECFFPHEIGIFLNYPLGDVIGFIVNKGKNSKCVGCWKVYCDECEAIKKFEKYKKCTKVYRKLWSRGISIEKLSVA